MFTAQVNKINCFVTKSELTDFSFWTFFADVVY